MDEEIKELRQRTVRHWDCVIVLFMAIVFTALHGMQTRYSDEKAVRLPVRLSVKRVNCDKTKERSVQILPYKRSFSLDFQADYITVVADRPIMSVIYCFSVPVFHFWPKL